MGALLALPAMWVDHEPTEIATGLLSVLFGVLQLDGAYVRFDDPQEGGRPLVSWRPSGPSDARRVAARARARADQTRAQGVTTTEVDVQELGTFRVTSLPLALPWETGLVLVSAGRSDFPTAMETHLLRVAVSQAAIAIHTSRRLAREHAARSVAEARCSDRTSSCDRSSTTSSRRSRRSPVGSRMRRASSPRSTRRGGAPPPTVDRASPSALPSERSPRTRVPPRSR